MRTSLEGTQASGEGESHTQQANVAEDSYGGPVLANPNMQTIVTPPGGSCERLGKDSF